MGSRRTFLRNGLYSFGGSILLLSTNGCKKYLNFLPEDRITSSNFPEDEEDIHKLLMGIYALLRENTIYLEGLYGFGVLDGATPNCFNWGATAIDRLGRGDLSSDQGQSIDFIWERCYTIIFRSNYFLQVIDKVNLDNEDKDIYIGEVHFLRGLAYSNLANYFGGVPIITKELTTEEARSVGRSTLDETWKQVTSDYDIAISNLKTEAPEMGRATLGAALGLKLRASLYQKKYNEVISLAEEIDSLNKYSLFQSYDGLFQLDNENSNEVLFDIQYMRGKNSQGSLVDQYCGTGTGTDTRGTRYVPTGNLVDSYERVDGTPAKYTESNIDLDNPYEGWDPRMKTTVVVPGAYFLGYRFPSYKYPGGAFNHPGCRLKQWSTRKYRIEPMSDLPPAGQSDLNYMVMRYADVLLSKAEAIIETDGNMNDAIDLINRIRTERDDVKLTPLPQGLSKMETRKKLRHERRIEFAIEGLFWSDIKRWDIGKDIYPVEIRDQNGSIIETKFPDGYKDYYKFFPIPNNELSQNHHLEQNPGW